MSRNTAAVTSASQLAQLRYRVLCHVDSLASGPVRACTGGNFIRTASNTYTPIGGFGGIDDPVAEDADIFPRTVRLWLAATNTSQIVDMVNESLFNKPVKLYRAFLTDSYTVVDTPSLLSSLRINKVSMKTNDTQRGNYYTIECESKLRRNARAQFYDKATLQQVYGNSGDTFFNFLYLIPTVRAAWGQLPNFGIPLTSLPPGSPGSPGWNPGNISGPNGY